MGGTFQVIASAAPGHTLDELETAIHEEIARFADEGPTTDELERGRAQAESAFVLRLQSLGGFGGKADQLNAYNVYLESPDSFDDRLRPIQPAPRLTTSGERPPNGSTVARPSRCRSFPRGAAILRVSDVADVAWGAE